ncbi:MAG: ABC transporter ATP-binding protein [Myxococcota bacterium]
MKDDEHVIEVDHIVRRFGDFTAVDDVSFYVERGEIFGYLGANGAGKSATIRMLCGLLSPTSGDARVAGYSVRDDSEGVKASIGYMSQKFSLYLDLPVRHNLEFFGGAYGLATRDLRRRIGEVVELTGLVGHEHVITRSLPGGIRQRAALACAILHQPKIVFLDEPTSGVDPLSRQRFWKLIRQMSTDGTTVFVTTHYMDEAEYCHRVGLMVTGRLVALDTPEGLKREHVPGQIFAVQGRELRGVARQLRGQVGFIAIQTFGSGLHVRVDPATHDEHGVKKALQELGARIDSVEPVEATLEDVFLEVVAPDTTREVA